MAQEQVKDLAQFIKHSALSKQIKAKVWQRISFVLAVGLLAVIFIPRFDQMYTGASQPGPITFIGTALTISLLTIYLFSVSLYEHLGGAAQILKYAIFYNVLIITVKFALGPASLYKANPTLVIGENDFNANWTRIGFMGFGILLLYLLAFQLLKVLAIRNINKYFNIKSTKIRTQAHSFIRLIFAALAIFIGGSAALVALMGVFGISGQYIGYVFSTGYSLLIALCLAAAVSCAGAMFAHTEKQVLLQRNLPLLINIIWTGIGLLLVYHVLWAVYLFVLTTLWPFKTVLPAPSK